MKDYERAFADYSHALEIAPENPELYIRRAHVLKGLSRVDEALADLQEAWRRDPRLVSFLQQQLKAAGLYDGEVNGIPDEATVESVRQWIAQNNRLEESCLIPRCSKVSLESPVACHPSWSTYHPPDQTSDRLQKSNAPPPPPSLRRAARSAIVAL